MFYFNFMCFIQVRLNQAIQNGRNKSNCHIAEDSDQTEHTGDHEEIDELEYTNEAERSRKVDENRRTLNVISVFIV